MQCVHINARVETLRLLALALVALLLLLLASGCTEAQRADQAAFDAGYAALEAGRYSQAVTELSRYLRSEPSSPARGEVYYYRGQALAHLKRPAEAQADFQRAIGAKATPPVDQFAHVALGNIYYEQGNDVEALRHYAVVIDEPNEAVPMPMVLLRAGRSLQRLGRWEKGDRYLRYLVAHYPTSAAGREARRYVSADGFSVQTGAYASHATATVQARQVRLAGFAPQLKPVRRAGRQLTAVRVDAGRTYVDALSVAGRLRQAGFETLIVP